MQLIRVDKTLKKADDLPHVLHLLVDATSRAKSKDLALGLQVVF